jgi:hypothetical protein
MTAKEVQKRNSKSEWLRVLQTEDGSFFVESSEGKILYNVILNDSETSCTCADFVRNSKKDPDFRCKHILSAMNCIPIGQVEAALFLDRKKPKLDDRWIMEIEGNQFVKFAGLLDLGHQKGISQIEVDTVQLPTKDNGDFAICKATVVSKTGESFTDIGDANPGNCSSKVVKHLLRLASTRAIARSLRTFTNIGMTCLEELADIDRLQPEFIADSLEFGTVIHRLLACYYAAKMVGDRMTLKDIHELFKKLWTDAAKDRDDIRYAEGKDCRSDLTKG